MNIEDLFAGAVLVIDDNVNNNESDDKILKIVSHLESKGIPLIKSQELPSIEYIKHYKCLNFILLDWDLWNLPLGVSSTSTLEDSLIEFVSKLLANLCIPIFIFSNEDPTAIKHKLEGKHVYTNIENVPLFVRRKNEIFADDECTIFGCIQNWLDQMSSIYVLKEWSNQLEGAKISMFKELLSTDANWPYIVLENAQTDCVNPLEDLTNIVTENVFARMGIVPFDIEQIQKNPTEPTSDVILSILKSQRFIDIVKEEEELHTGDFFVIDRKFFINIRPACDCVERDGSIVKAYLLRCSKITKAKLSGLFNRAFGNFSSSEHTNEVIIGPIYRNSFYKIFFSEIKIEDYNDIKDKKVGKVLPPFLVGIIQKYSLYMQRVGLPRIPNLAIPNAIVEQVDNEVEEKLRTLQNEVEKLKKENESLLKQDIVTKSYRTTIHYIKRGRKKKK